MYIAVKRNTEDLGIVFRFETKKDMEEWMDEFREFEADRFLQMEEGSAEMAELGEVITALEMNMFHTGVPEMFEIPAGEYETQLRNKEVRVLATNLTRAPFPENAKARDIRNIAITKLPGWGHFDASIDTTFPENDRNIIIRYRCEADITGLCAAMVLLFYQELVREKRRG